MPLWRHERMIILSTDKRRYTLRLQDENFKKIKVIAEHNKRSIAMQIEYIIEKEIERFENEHGKITIEEEYV